MQLKDLVKPLDQMSDEELLTYLREIRHRRTVERPVAKAKAERVEKKATRHRMTALEKILAGMSPEEQIALLKKPEDK